MNEKLQKGGAWANFLNGWGKIAASVFVVLVFLIAQYFQIQNNTDALTKQESDAIVHEEKLKELTKVFNDKIKVVEKRLDKRQARNIAEDKELHKAIHELRGAGLDLTKKVYYMDGKNNIND